jgi:hypothetical protein
MGDDVGVAVTSQGRFPLEHDAGQDERPVDGLGGFGRLGGFGEGMDVEADPDPHRRH